MDVTYVTKMCSNVKFRLQKYKNTMIYKIISIMYKNAVLISAPLINGIRKTTVGYCKRTLVKHQVF